MKIRSLLLVLISGSNYECSTRPKFLIENGKIIGLDLNADNKSDYLNTCSSIESEHLSVWVDELKKARLAYASRHIDADLLETCGNIDYS